jgi:EmrB/QacA subfamily drug resistance transporter
MSSVELNGASAVSERVAKRHIHPGLALVILSASTFMATLDVWITQVGLPSIGRGVHASSLSDLSWVLSAYAIVYAALLVPAGRLADRIGRKAGFLTGLGLFTAASLAAALSGDIWVLVAFRMIQAIGAALMTPSSLGLVLTTAPADKVTQYVKFWVTSAALAAAAGPVFGGLLVDVSWRWIFLINIPIGVVVFVAAARLLPETQQDRHSRLPDVLGGIVLIIGIGALALGVVKGTEWGWSSGRVIASFAVAVVALAAFFASSSRHPAPVIELNLFRDRVFASGNAAIFLFFTAFAIELLSLILWMEGHWHYSPIKVGLAAALGPCVVPIFATIAENLQKKLNLKPGHIAAFGLALVGGGAIIFATQIHDSPHWAAALLPGWLTVGAGVGLAVPTIVSSATVELRPDEAATGSAIVSMAQQVGSVIGVSILVAILGAASGGATLLSFQHAWITAACLAGAGVFAALGITPKAGAVPAMVAAAVPLGDAAQSGEIGSAVPLLTEVSTYTKGSNLNEHGNLN